MKCNAKLRPNYFTVTFLPTILTEIIGFFKFVGEMQQLVQKYLQQNN